MVGRLCLTILALSTSVFAAGRPAPVSLTPEGEKLEAHYSKMLADLEEAIKRLEPKVDEKKKAEFTKQFGTLGDVPPVTKIVMGKEIAVKHGPGNPAFTEKQKAVLTAARVVMKDIETFLVGEKEQAIMAKFALLTHATPKRLAGFAQKGEEEKALIDTLLNDDKLVVQAMTMGGASGGNYGQAMRNYTAIQKAAERSHEGFFQVWALAASLQYTGETYVYPDVPAAESLVNYYLNYLKAYDDGILDPAFSKLGGTGWDYRFVFPDAYKLEDIDWIRTMMRNYRPDHIRNPDYKWRYCRIVRTDVPYTSGVDRSGMSADLSKFQKFFLKGGICGPRAFVGQLSGYAFGIPSRRAPSTGHAAMAHWTPDGWTTVLGPHFAFCKVNGMPGMEFLLTSQCHKEPEPYKQVLKCEWLGNALGEDGVTGYGSGGGFWKLLAFYRKLALVEDATIEDIGVTGEELAESNVEAVEEEIHQIELTDAQKTIVIGKDGVITIPPGAAHATVNTDKLRFMHTIDGDEVQVHYSLGAGRPELLKFNVEAPAAGKYELTAEICTLTLDREFMLRLNRRTIIDIALPYTKGYWGKTKPTQVDLKRGRNTFQFTIKAPNKGISIKCFKLKPVG
ncbi:MAG: hypothetical protein ACI9UA_002822 [Pseudoalteromonas tetraodonis]|jgi:hypothetical protein